MKTILSNLTAGWRAATFHDVSVDDFRVDTEGAVGMIGFGVFVWWCAGNLLGALAGPLFRSEILFSGAIEFAVIFAVSAILPYLVPVPDLPKKLTVVLLSLSPIACLGAVVVHLERTAGVGGAGTAVSALCAAWALLVHYRGLKVVTGLRTATAIPVFALYLGLSLVPSITMSLL